MDESWHQLHGKRTEMRTVKDIAGHPGYKATSTGEIIGKRGKEMKGHIDHCGYHEVLLSENGQTKNYLVHRLIAQTFISNPQNLDFVNHKDGNKQNNSADNLEWCSRSENTKHSYRIGLQQRATNRYGTFRVLSAEDETRIYDLHRQGLLDKEIAAKIGCSRELVSRKIRNAGLR